MTIQEIITTGTNEERKALFSFTKQNTNEQIKLKFNLWARYFFAKYFTSADCKAHEEMDFNNIKAYRSEISQYVNIAYRGFSKTARTKLFLAFCIANDQDHSKRFIRCISADLDNAKQSVTDIYNMFIQPRVKELYPEIFIKTDNKREETMSSFTTATGIKVISKQIGVDQRGKIMEDAKSDLDWYDDVETKTTIRSALITHKIGENMEEARTGLAINGSSIYTANYFSEAGNIHKIVIKKVEGKVIQITPIITDIVKEIKTENGESIEHIVGGNITWNRYSIKDIDIMFLADEDFEGERLCKPNASKDIYFDRDKLDAMIIRQPIKEISGFKIFKEYNAGHRYAGGHDIAGGVGLDSSTSVFIDFDTIPAQVVGTFHSNTILPEAFGDEVYSQGNRFGGCLLGIENNKFDQTILKAKQLGADLFMTPAKAIKAGFSSPTTYGWNTNSLTKSKMLPSLREAIESGLLDLNDEELINECKGFTRNDLIDNPPDIRLTTRHWDLVTALAISWQMKDYCRQVKIKKVYYSNAVVSNPAI